MIKYMEDIFGLGNVIFLGLGHGNMHVHFLLFIKSSSMVYIFLSIYMIYDLLHKKSIE